MIITLINNLYNSKLPSQYMNINDKSTDSLKKCIRY